MADKALVNNPTRVMFLYVHTIYTFSARNRGRRVRVSGRAGVPVGRAPSRLDAGEGTVCAVRIWKRQLPWPAMNRRS